MAVAQQQRYLGCWKDPVFNFCEPFLLLSFFRFFLWYHIIWCDYRELCMYVCVILYIHGILYIPSSYDSSQQCYSIDFSLYSCQIDPTTRKRVCNTYRHDMIWFDTAVVMLLWIYKNLMVATVSTFFFFTTGSVRFGSVRRVFSWLMIRPPPLSSRSYAYVYIIYHMDIYIYMYRLTSGGWTAWKQTARP